MTSKNDLIYSQHWFNTLKLHDTFKVGVAQAYLKIKSHTPIFGVAQMQPTNNLSSYLCSISDTTNESTTTTADFTSTPFVVLI